MTLQVDNAIFSRPHFCSQSCIRTEEVHASIVVLWFDISSEVGSGCFAFGGLRVVGIVWYGCHFGFRNIQLVGQYKLAQKHARVCDLHHRSYANIKITYIYV